VKSPKLVAMNETRRDHFETALPQFTAASDDEIRYAEYLRRQIERRYLENEHASEPYWYVGAD
jgi:hypothetical protein